MQAGLLLLSITVFAMASCGISQNRTNSTARHENPRPCLRVLQLELLYDVDDITQDCVPGSTDAQTDRQCANNVSVRFHKRQRAIWSLSEPRPSSRSGDGERSNSIRITNIGQVLTAMLVPYRLLSLDYTVKVRLCHNTFVTRRRHSDDVRGRYSRSRRYRVESSRFRADMVVPLY